MGHRVTLTYNLYFALRVGRAFQQPNPIVDASRIPVHKALKWALEKRTFLPDGGMLGIFCCHRYPHPENSANQTLPKALKGNDLVTYSAFKSLRLRVKIAPVLESLFDWDRHSRYGGLQAGNLLSNGVCHVHVGSLLNVLFYQEKGRFPAQSELYGQGQGPHPRHQRSQLLYIDESDHRPYDSEPESDTEDASEQTFEERFEVFSRRKIAGLSRIMERNNTTLVGENFAELSLDQSGDYEEIDEEEASYLIFRASWPKTWLTRLAESGRAISLHPAGQCHLAEWSDESQ